MRRAAALAVAVVTAAGCGGKDRLDVRTPGVTPQSNPAKAGAGGPAATATPVGPPVTRQERAVIRGWSEALRHGHVAAAARYFSIPSLVSNNTPPIQLTSRKEVELFNTTLPCGAKLLRTSRAVHGFVAATFRLTERTGPGAQPCPGRQLAQTAFLIRAHRITQWLRLPDPSEGADGSTDSS